MVGVPDIFSFFLLGEGEGGVRGAGSQGGGVNFLLKIPGGGGGVLREGEGARAGRVSAVNCGIAGGGAKHFLFGAEMSANIVI